MGQKGKSSAPPLNIGRERNERLFILDWIFMGRGNNECHIPNMQDV
jgi:hypothetical protein